MKEKEDRKLLSSKDIISKDITYELLAIIKNKGNNRYGYLLKFISNVDVLLSSFEHIVRKDGY